MGKVLAEPVTEYCKEKLKPLNILQPLSHFKLSLLFPMMPFRCSDGADRHRAEWHIKGCYHISVKKVHCKFECGCEISYCSPNFFNHWGPFTKQNLSARKVKRLDKYTVPFFLVVFREINCLPTNQSSFFSVKYRAVRMGFLCMQCKAKSITIKARKVACPFLHSKVMELVFVGDGKINKVFKNWGRGIRFH